MAQKQEVIRIYSLTDAEVMQLGDKAVSLMNRDAAELLTYGIDATDRDFVATKTQEFKDFPTDEELVGNITVKTQEKDAAAEAVRVAIRSIMVRAKNAFGTESGKYSTFAFKGMNELKDDGLYRMCKRIVRISELYLAELALEGLTQAIIDEITALNTAFDNAIDAKDEAVEKRDMDTEERIELGNLLYAKIVEVFDAGKDYWITRNEAKYNDYIIYESAAPATVYTVVLATKQSVLTPINIVLMGENGKKIIAEWGDGVTETYTMNGSYVIASHTYTAQGNYTIRLKGEKEAFWELFAPDAKITAINLPAELTLLRALDLLNNLLTSFFLPLTYLLMLSLQLNNNELDQQSINQILITVNGLNTNNGMLNLAGGTNAAPSGQGIAAMNQLIARGWTVVTN